MLRLVRTHHRDFDDQQIYKTTKVYLMRVSLESKGAIVPTTLPQGKSLIDTKWVYALLNYKYGEIARFKARLVAKRFEQIAGIDFDQTFSPVARMASLRLLLALSAVHRFEVHQMDGVSSTSIRALPISSL